MKALSVLVKSLREQWRDIWTLLLTLASSPFFVLVYWMFFGGGSTTYGVLILNRDAGTELPDGTVWNAGADIIRALKENVTYEDGQSMLDVEFASSRKDAEKQLKDREAAALLIIPEDFSRSLLDGEVESSMVTIVGDLTYTYYSIAAVLTNAALDGYLQSFSDQPRPVQVTEDALGGSGARTEFEMYVPGMMIFAVMMLIYQASMVITHEVEAGTLRRLKITRMTAFDYVVGISLSQVLIGVVAVALTFATAVALDFESQGPIWVAIVIGAVTSLAMVGVGLLVACYSRTVSRAFMISTFPLFLMMFFSGAFFPVGDVPLFTVGGRTIQAFDLLPPTHAVVALNKVLTLGEGLGDILFELSAVLVLSLVYFVVGVWIFRRTQLSRQ